MERECRGLCWSAAATGGKLWSLVALIFEGRLLGCLGDIHGVESTNVRPVGKSWACAFRREKLFTIL